MSSCGYSSCDIILKEGSAKVKKRVSKGKLLKTQRILSAVFCRVTLDNLRKDYKQIRRKSIVLHVLCAGVDLGALYGETGF
jgi:hypothetical protein